MTCRYKQCPSSLSGYAIDLPGLLFNHSHAGRSCYTCEPDRSFCLALSLLQRCKLRHDLSTARLTRIVGRQRLDHFDTSSASMYLARHVRKKPASQTVLHDDTGSLGVLDQPQSSHSRCYLVLPVSHSLVDRIKGTK